MKASQPIRLTRTLQSRERNRGRSPKALPGQSRPPGLLILSMTPWPSPSAGATEPRASLLPAAILAKTVLAFAVFCSVRIPAPVTGAQDRPVPADLIATAARNGDRVTSALSRYAYYSELTIETIGPDDVVTGKYHRLSRITHDRTGVRQERVFEERSTLPPDSFINSNAVNAMTRVYQF